MRINSRNIIEFLDNKDVEEISSLSKKQKMNLLSSVNRDNILHIFELPEDKFDIILNIINSSYNILDIICCNDNSLHVNALRILDKLAIPAIFSILEDANDKSNANSMHFFKFYDSKIIYHLIGERILHKSFEQLPIEYFVHIWDFLQVEYENGLLSSEDFAEEEVSNIVKSIKFSQYEYITKTIHNSNYDNLCNFMYDILGLDFAKLGTYEVNNIIEKFPNKKINKDLYTIFTKNIFSTQDSCFMMDYELDNIARNLCLLDKNFSYFNLENILEFNDKRLFVNLTNVFAFMPQTFKLFYENNFCYNELKAGNYKDNIESIELLYNEIYKDGGFIFDILHDFSNVQNYINFNDSKDIKSFTKILKSIKNLNFTKNLLNIFLCNIDDLSIVSHIIKVNLLQYSGIVKLDKEMPEGNLSNLLTKSSHNFNILKYLGIEDVTRFDIHEKEFDFYIFIPPEKISNNLETDMDCDFI